MKALFILLLVFPFSLLAQDWKVISVGDNSNYYIRKHSENPGDTKVWIKEEGHKIEYTNSAGTKMLIKGKHIVLWDIHCSDKQIALISTTIYNSTGTVLKNTVIPFYSVEFQDVIPESKGELWLNEACNLFNPEEIILEEEVEEFFTADTLIAEEMVEYIEPEIEVENTNTEEEFEIATGEIIEPEEDTELEVSEPYASEDPEDDGQIIYKKVDEQAKFLGGQMAWLRYLKSNLKYPPAAQRAKIRGQVIVTFVVNKNGSIESVKLIKGLGFGCNEEAIRLIKAMPRWIPGKKSGVAVRSHYTQRINF
jgi:TonB family protein